MAQKTKKQTKRVNRTPQELLQAEYEKSQLRAMADNDGPSIPMDVFLSQGELPPDEPAPMPAPSPAFAPLDALRDESALVLTVADVCALLKISRRTLERSNVPGKLKIGGSVRYHKVVLEQWLKQQAEPSP